MPPVPKKSGDRCVGRSRGGITTKIHARVDAKGRPRKLRGCFCCMGSLTGPDRFEGSSNRAPSGHLFRHQPTKPMRPKAGAGELARHDHRHRKANHEAMSETCAEALVEGQGESGAV